MSLPSGTLPDMSQPADLSRRVDRTESDLTAIADTVVEIKETVEQHSDTLAEHGRQLTAIQDTQREHGATLNAILARLDQLTG